MTRVNATDWISLPSVNPGIVSSLSDPREDAKRLDIHGKKGKPGRRSYKYRGIRETAGNNVSFEITRDKWNNRDTLAIIRKILDPNTSTNFTALPHYHILIPLITPGCRAATLIPLTIIISQSFRLKELFNRSAIIAAIAVIVYPMIPKTIAPFFPSVYLPSFEDRRNDTLRKAIHL